MTDRKLTVWARVQVTVEVPVGPWPANATFEEVCKTAVREGPEVVATQLRTHGRVIGEPKVEIVMAKEGT